jgi:hypothetical protein
MLANESKMDPLGILGHLGIRLGFDIVDHEVPAKYCGYCKEDWDGAVRSLEVRLEVSTDALDPEDAFLVLMT